MGDQQAKSSRRLIPRFSLRTLMILMALAGSGYALYAGWKKPWGHLYTITVPTDKATSKVECYVTFIGFSRDDEFISAIVHLTPYVDTLPASHDRVCLWTADSPTHYLTNIGSDSEHPVRLVSRTHGYQGEFILDIRGGASTHNAKSYSFPTITRKYFYWRWGEDDWLYSRSENYRAALGDRLGSIEVQQLRRPMAWYGVFWLPEFYLVVLCAVGLRWSVWRDGRRPWQAQA